MSSFYVDAGGEEAFRRITTRFFAAVAADPVLATMYPADLTGPEQRLRAYFTQYWGGPRAYSQSRGHPRLRMRHSPFPITPQARDRWLSHMRTAIEEAGLPVPLATIFWEHLHRSAANLVNRN